MLHITPVPADNMHMEQLRPGFASRRKHPRFPAALACSVRWPGGKAEGSVIDLAARGAAITLPHLPEGGRGHFELVVFPDDENPLMIGAETVSAGRDPFGGWVVRMRFVGLSPEAEADLNGVIENLRREFADSQAKIALDRLGPARRARYAQYPPFLLRRPSKG